MGQTARQITRAAPMMCRSLLTLFLVLGLMACQTAEPAGPAATDFVRAQVDATTYRVRHIGKTRDTTGMVESRMLRRAAALARDRGFTHFAVLEQRIKTIPSPTQVSPTISVQRPLVRSTSRSSLRRSGSVTGIDLGRPLVYSASATIRLFSGDAAPAGAQAVYDARALP